MKFVKLMVAMTPCFVARAAVAQPAAAPAPQSVLPNMLPLSAGATVDTRIDATRVHGGYFEGITLFALNLHGQSIRPSGLGGYVSLPIAFVTDGDVREMDLGNLEIGGLYVLRGAHVEAFVRGAAALKATSINGGLLSALSSIVPRPTDALASGLDSNWLRGQVGLRVTSGPLVVGGSGGVDAAFSSDGELGRIFHVSGSIGIAQPRFGVALGVTMLRPLEEGDGIVGFQATADTAIGARTRLYIAFGLSREDIADASSAGIGLRTGL